MHVTRNSWEWTGPKVSYLAAKGRPEKTEHTGRDGCRPGHHHSHTASQRRLLKTIQNLVEPFINVKTNLLFQLKILSFLAALKFLVNST